jgi:BirA family biotin operon repressor/biotin-[acetyl-CoA-carboxylase] ligase
MKIIKLDAIDSTNTFLKELCKENDVENYTVVITHNQTKGRGQMATAWNSEENNNLTFSILTKFNALDVSKQFWISKAISLALCDTLSTFLSAKINIKWPNDILAEEHKICGILIENSVKKSKIKHSIVGIGLNVNQMVFQNLPNATSMKLISGKFFNLDEVLEAVVDNIKKYVGYLNENNFKQIDDLYFKQLYKMNVPTMFQDINETIFMGKILGTTVEGKLQVELEDETIKEFLLKEIQFVKLG